MTAPHTARHRPGPAPRGLHRFTRPRPPAPERCELCGTALDTGHRHLVDTTRRSLACACPPCALLFDRPGAGGGRFCTVPDRVLADPGSAPSAAAWAALHIPVALAFFFHHSGLGRPVALCPSPAGATETEIDPAAWDTAFADSRLAALLAPDVEALLVRRTGDAADCYLVPVDTAYELVGRMRLHWTGFDGGAEARAALDTFFTALAERATGIPEEAAHP
ncbi:DUF5947 family protein [Streptomyces sp. NPDC014733]|uniref:DUF5947 family protein n=1 Tax=Streptomyces sp. NPDC014733 TaxID=3364885 RepID=UPI0036FF20B4